MGLTMGAEPASAAPIFMPDLTNALSRPNAITPPAPPCPVPTGTLPAPLVNCGLPEFPAAGVPYPGNMAYWGGHVQVTPKVYVVYWGWGEQGAFPARQTCSSETINESATSVTLACDPDGAGKYIADWVDELGGTQWAGVQTQYFQLGASRHKQHVTNPSDQLAGLWADDTNDISGLAKTSANNRPGPANTYTDLAAEAERAVAHFGITDLADSDIVIAQPPNYSDPNAIAQGYCAFHDYIEPNLSGNIYNGLTPTGVSYTNLPYQLAINVTSTTGGQVNVCGQNAVNSGSAGRLDGFSIVLGHEIEETVTDPGAEDIVGTTLKTTRLGAWYDPFDANENGDKCAWVGEPLVSGLPGEPNVLPIAGALGDIKGNRGDTFAVQSLWSNSAAGGVGWCAGAGTDLPSA
jgi:serine protease